MGISVAVNVQCQVEEISSDMAVNFKIELNMPEMTHECFQKLIQSIDAFQRIPRISTEHHYKRPWMLKSYTWPTIREYSLHEEHILEIRKLTGCSSQEADVYLQIYPYEPRLFSINNLVWHIQTHGHFPLIQGYEYSCCLNCHKRQWRYIGNRRGPCVYCGYYDPNIDPRFSIEVGESERFQPGETDIEI